MNAFGHNDSAVPSAKTIIQDVQSLSRLLSNSKRTKQMDLSLNNTMVQIIACLRDDGQQSVPRIARKLDVGRQHIQRTVNDLMERDLVCRLPNPDHQRSWLINLTQNGQSIDESRNKDEMALAQTL
ncbi:MAG: winged helix-turn-helix transcriptional regulator, partial [Rhodospirillales bacterium]|nr:winged helix-turn-helix transcriptional regulator [Rhodospirillales bacterium]